MRKNASALPLQEFTRCIWRM